MSYRGSELHADVYHTFPRTALVLGLTKKGENLALVRRPPFILLGITSLQQFVLAHGFEELVTVAGRVFACVHGVEVVDLGVLGQRHAA